MEWQPLLLSFRIALIATIVASVLGIALGAALERFRFPGRDVLDVLITAPMVLPPTVLGYYVLVALGRRSVIGRAFENLTGDAIVFTTTGAIVAATISALPFITKSSRSALESVDHTLVSAARTLGAGPFRAFFTVHLPLAARGVIAGVMLGFAKALGDFGVTLMVAGNIPGETQTAALAIYDMVQANREGDAAIMIMALSAVAVITLYSVNKLTAKTHAH